MLLVGATLQWDLVALLEAVLVDHFHPCWWLFVHGYLVQQVLFLLLDRYLLMRCVVIR